MSSAPGSRAARVAERIKAEIMEMVLRGAVRDPRAQQAIVTDVKVSPDLRYARVYVRVLEDDVSDRRRRGVVEALGGAGKFMRREMGKRLHLKQIPELQFEWDDVIDDALRVERVLHELQTEREAKAARDHEDPQEDLERGDPDESVEPEERS